MKRITFLTVLQALLLILAVPAFGLAATGPVLIVHDGTAVIEADVLGNLTTHLTAAGYTVSSNVGVPAGSLAANKQIWDVRFNNTTPLTAADITAYSTYLDGGGSLFVMGENTGFMTRDSSLVALVTAVGGGTLTISTPANLETVLPPFTGPNPLSSITFLAAAGATSPPGNGAFVAKDGSNIGASVVFSPGTMSAASNGSLILVFDVNFLQASADANSQTFTDNLIAYLAAPAPVVAATVPTVSELGMIVMAMLMLGAAVVAMRRRRRASL